MKEDYTKFKCDICSITKTTTKGTGFPYSDDWCYIYKFEAKFLKSHTPAIETEICKVELKDKHFCSEKCMLIYIKKCIKASKGIEKNEKT